MDVDGQRTQGMVPPRCYRCNSFDHLTPACPHCFNVLHMTHTERDNFATAILIDRDTVPEIDINDDVVEPKVVEREVTEQDFV